MLICAYVGEANAHGNGTDTYACTFAKMIQSWRQIWNERTNGSTRIDFPFGFVQVNMNRNERISRERERERAFVFIVINIFQYK